MTETTAKSRAERKRERKLLREAARDREVFEQTPFGRKRKSHCPTAVTRMLSALAAAGLFLWHLIRGDQTGKAPDPANEPPHTDLKKAA